MTVFTNLGISDSEFRAELDLPAVVVDWLIVPRAEHEFLLVIAMVDTHPHPFRGLAHL